MKCYIRTQPLSFPFYNVVNQSIGKLCTRRNVVQFHFVQRPKERPIKYILDAIRFGQNGCCSGKRPVNIIPQRYVTCSRFISILVFVCVSGSNVIGE